MGNPVTIIPVNWSDEASQAALRTVRTAVFVREQGVPEELEWEPLDGEAFHLLARDDFGQPVGVARMLSDGHIGRVAVLKAWRGKGIASEIMEALLREARRRGLPEVHLNAQITAIPFYQRLGFIAEGPDFMDAGIPHRHMRLPL